MSEENVEIVRDGYEALNELIAGRGNIDTWLEGFHDDVEAHDLPTIPDAPVRRGHDDMRRWVEMTRDIWSEDSRYEPKDLTAFGDFVVVAVYAHGKGRGSGVPVEASFFQVFQMREGKVQRTWAFFDKAEALEAAGLSE